MPRFITFILFIAAGIHSLYAQNDDQIVIGTKHTIHSKTLDENREYWVSLPDSYHEESSSYKNYPVLIVLDGRLHFKSIAGMVNYMSAGYNGNRRIPEMIVVAIQNVNRRRDFTPDKIVTRRENDSGGGDKFLSFLEGELIPQLDEKFRTIPYRILYGHSLGGLLATHAYMREKTLFNSFIAVDPSFGTWDAETMDKKLAAVTDQSFDRYIYFATANWGKRNIRNRDRHMRLYEALNSKCKDELPAKLEYYENENHGSVPLVAFHNGISSIFKGYGISYRDIESKEQLVDHYQSLSQRLSWDFNPPEALVNRVGYGMLRSENEHVKLEALSLFILNTENYPKSFNAFDSLGEVYEALADNEKAIENYKKSLELNPTNQHAKTKIESLKK
jgi:predicted alpha/beta superfamily hydrolase